MDALWIVYSKLLGKQTIENYFRAYMKQRRRWNQNFSALQWDNCQFYFNVSFLHSSHLVSNMNRCRECTSALFLASVSLFIPLAKTSKSAHRNPGLCWPESGIFHQLCLPLSTIPVSLTWPSSSRKRLLASSFHPRALPFERTCLSWAPRAPISLYILSLQTLQVAFQTR